MEPAPAQQLVLNVAVRVVSSSIRISEHVKVIYSTISWTFKGCLCNKGVEKLRHGQQDCNGTLKSFELYLNKGYIITEHC